MVHTVTTFITSPSWTSCGRYIEISLTLTVLEDLLNSVDRMDVLKGNLILQCNRYSKIDYPKINSIKFTTVSVNTKQKWTRNLLLLFIFMDSLLNTVRSVYIYMYIYLILCQQRKDHSRFLHRLMKPLVPLIFQMQCY